MTQLIKYSAACQALAEAKATDEVKDLRDKAEAMRAYAHQAKNRQMEIDAAEIRIRAERRLGELIRQQKDTVGLNAGTAGMGDANVGRGTGGTKSEPPVKVPKLADAGIDKKLSSHAQKVAAIPEDEFENILGDWRGTLQQANERVTTNILNAAERVKARATSEWSDSELHRKHQVERGLTVVASKRAGADGVERDAALIGWAKNQGLLVEIGRNSAWGNPFELPGDGTRDEVCDNYANHYLPHKPSLIKRLDSLRGKVLVCWCHPERCHGDHLAEIANGR